MYVLVEFKQKRLKYHLKMCVFDDFGSELECRAGLRSEADVFRCELERICFLMDSNWKVIRSEPELRLVTFNSFP